MNRRLLWALLALLPLVALFGLLRRAVSFRPVKIGSMIESKTSDEFFSPLLMATDREVLARLLDARPTLFDLKTGKRELWPGGVTVGGEALWRLSASGAPQLLVRDGAGTRAYALSAAAHKRARESDVQAVVVALSDANMMMFASDRFTRWNRKSGALEQSMVLGQSLGEYALTRDGRNIVSLNYDGIDWIPLKSAAATRKMPVTGFEAGTRNFVSPFGSYVSYEDRSAGTKPASHAMVDARTGRMLWRFDSENNAEPVFSPDEKWVAISRASPSLWELRETRSGRVVGSLVNVFRGPYGGDGPAQFGGFSPDGATFYSLTPQSDVYRQRAR